MPAELNKKLVRPIEEVLNRFTRVYLVGYSDQPDKPHTPILVNFKDVNDDTACYLSEVIRETDYRLNALRGLIEFAPTVTDFRGKFSKGQKPEKTIHDFIHEFESDLDVLSGGIMKPIIFERNEDGIIVDHKIIRGENITELRQEATG